LAGHDLYPERGGRRADPGARRGPRSVAAVASSFLDIPVPASCRGGRRSRAHWRGARRRGGGGARAEAAAPGVRADPLPGSEVAEVAVPRDRPVANVGDLMERLFGKRARVRTCAGRWPCWDCSPPFRRCHRPGSAPASGSQAVRDHRLQRRRRARWPCGATRPARRRRPPGDAPQPDPRKVPVTFVDAGDLLVQDPAAASRSDPSSPSRRSSCRRPSAPSVLGAQLGGRTSRPGPMSPSRAPGDGRAPISANLVDAGGRPPRAGERRDRSGRARRLVGADDPACPGRAGSPRAERPRWSRSGRPS
jgi:hypothetical protein